MRSGLRPPPHAPATPQPASPWGIFKRRKVGNFQLTMTRDRVVLRESIESIRKQVRDYLQDLTGPDRSLHILLQIGHELDPLLREPAMVNSVRLPWLRRPDPRYLRAD